VEKCRHGIYLESPDAVQTHTAFYCYGCNPTLGLKAYKGPAFRLAIDAPTDLTRTSCPRCGSKFHVVVKGRKWQCSDCGRTWRTTKR
jgi:tRNA(Ile2) C34 agmatinyltransferase TiaS